MCNCLFFCFDVEACWLVYEPECLIAFEAEVGIYDPLLSELLVSINEMGLETRYLLGLRLLYLGPWFWVY